MPQIELINSLSFLDDSIIATWCHHALTKDFIDPKPDYPENSGIDYVVGIHNKSELKFQHRFRKILYNLMLDYIEGIKKNDDLDEVEFIKENFYKLTLVFEKITLFKYHRTSIGNLLFKERKTLLINSVGVLSLYGLLLNLYVLWSDGSKDELIENDQAESYALAEYLTNFIDTWKNQQFQDLNILLVGLKYFANRRLIYEFFENYEKFALLKELDNDRKLNNLSNLFIYLAIVKRTQGQVEGLGDHMLNSVFHAFIMWFLESNCSDEFLDKLGAKLKERLNDFNTQSDAYYALLLLLGDHNAGKHFNSISGIYQFVSPANDIVTTLPTDLYDVIHTKINKMPRKIVRSARTKPKSQTREYDIDEVFKRDLALAAQGAAVESFL